MPNLSIALFSDQPVKKGREFDLVFESHDYDHPQKLKMHGMLHSPFERTLYIDSDTLTQGDFTELFGLLDFYDIGITHRVKCEWPPNSTPVFIDYVDHDCVQGGFLLFRKSEAARAFIQDWADEFFQTPGHLIQPGTEYGDQVVMNRVYKGAQRPPIFRFYSSRIRSTTPALGCGTSSKKTVFGRKRKSFMPMASIHHAT